MAVSEVTLIYEGKDITGSVMVAECVHRDASRGESDCLNITLERAKTWMGWNPKVNDSIRVKRNGYDSGVMYLNTIIPESGTFRMLATAIKSVNRPVKCASYTDMTLMQIMRLNAAECGMGARIYGAFGAGRYSYMIRDGETAAAFIDRLLTMEGAVFKAQGGDFIAIGIEYAQGVDAGNAVTLDMSKPGTRYVDRRSAKWAGVKIVSPLCSGSARDSAATGETRVFSNLPVRNYAEAKRWAKGLLIANNRQAEVLTIESTFNPGYTAMARVDVKGNDQLAGKWIVDSAEHDFIHDITRVDLLRCISTIT